MCIIRQFKILLNFFPFLVFPFAFIPRFSITGFVLYMTSEVKKKCTEAKGFGHHKLPSSAIPPSNTATSPLLPRLPLPSSPSHYFPLNHPPTPKLFSYFLLFPCLLNHPLYHLCHSHQNISLSFILYFRFSTNPLILDLRKKKGGNCSPSQQPLCTLLYSSVRSVARCIMGLPCWSVDGQARYKSINVQCTAKILVNVSLRNDP